MPAYRIRYGTSAVPASRTGRFFYVINFGQKPFKELNDERFIKRNTFIGWAINMVIILGGLYLVFMVMNSF